MKITLLIILVQTIARSFLGTPYMAHPLDQKQGEELDTTTTAFDCQTFVETVTAKALCPPHGAWADTLRALRYHQGQVAYPNRHHYFSQWIIENQQAGRVADVLKDCHQRGITTIANKVDFITHHTQLYPQLTPHPQWVETMRKNEAQLSKLTVRHIPRESSLLKKENQQRLKQIIHNGDILALTATTPGLDIAHLGFAIWKTDGLHLLHASQRAHKVVIEPVTIDRYFKQHPKFAGMRVIRIINHKR